jgi:hypothetical protein
MAAGAGLKAGANGAVPRTVVVSELELIKSPQFCWPSRFKRNPSNIQVVTMVPQPLQILPLFLLIPGQKTPVLVEIDHPSTEKDRFSEKPVLDHLPKDRSE